MAWVYGDSFFRFVFKFLRICVFFLGESGVTGIIAGCLFGLLYGLDFVFSGLY